MAKDKTLQYRMDGFIFALLFLSENRHTLDDLYEEIRLREMTDIKSILSFEELNGDKNMKLMIQFLHEAHDICWCMALRNQGFGKERILRNYNRVMQKIPSTIQEAYALREEGDKTLRQCLRKKHFRDEDKTLIPRSLQEYIDYREDGLVRAAEIVKTQGLNALRRMITRTKYTESMAKKENIHVNNTVRSIINEARILEWLISLHENEGFGNERMKRTMDEFEKVYGKLQLHEEGFENYLDEIQQITGVRLSEECLKLEPDYPKVHHKKPKKKKKKAKKKKMAIQLPPIQEPEFDFMSCPCFGCAEKGRCYEEGYRKQCTCLELYKEVRKENVRKNLEVIYGEAI